MKLTYQLAQNKDLETLSTFVNRAYRGDTARVGWTHEADLLDGTRVAPCLLKSELERGVKLVLALADFELLGCYHFEIKDNETAYVGMITVEPTRQGQGVGKLLIENAVERARQNGAKSLALTVMSDRHELIAYYERRGFKLTGAGEDFNPGDERYGRPKKSLRLIGMKMNL